MSIGRVTPITAKYIHVRYQKRLFEICPQLPSLRGPPPAPTTCSFTDTTRYMSGAPVPLEERCSQRTRPVCSQRSLLLSCQDEGLAEGLADGALSRIRALQGVATCCLAVSSASGYLCHGAGLFGCSLAAACVRRNSPHDAAHQANHTDTSSRPRGRSPVSRVLGTPQVQLFATQTCTSRLAS